MCGVAAADSRSSTISARGSPAERGHQANAAASRDLGCRGHDSAGVLPNRSAQTRITLNSQSAESPADQGEGDSDESCRTVPDESHPAGCGRPPRTPLDGAPTRSVPAGFLQPPRRTHHRYFGIRSRLAPPVSWHGRRGPPAAPPAAGAPRRPPRQAPASVGRGINANHDRAHPVHLLDRTWMPGTPWLAAVDHIPDRTC
jgi:hypothetical protein